MYHSRVIKPHKQFAERKKERSVLSGADVLCLKRDNQFKINK